MNGGLGCVKRYESPWVDMTNDHGRLLVKVILLLLTGGAWGRCLRYKLRNAVRARWLVLGLDLLFHPSQGGMEQQPAVLETRKARRGTPNLGLIRPVLR